MAPLWERLVCRYMVGEGIPAFRWDEYRHRFTGIKGFSFVRATPRNEGGWCRMPETFKKYEGKYSQDSPHPVVMFLTSKDNGPNTAESFVLMRLEPFAGMLKSLVESDPARYLGED